MTNLVLVPGRPGASLVVCFIAESTLAYRHVDGVDVRLHTWSANEGQWVVAFASGAAVGIACVVTLDDGPYARMDCLLWLEVLPEARRKGVGRALLTWATQQSPRLIIASTPSATLFYAAHLPGAQRIGDLFIVETGPCGANGTAEETLYREEAVLL
jgi:GNAT superfamily N-acetyltransferase